jgi:hypothetical protein
VTGGGVEATALRVTLASDSTGVVSVDDNGSTLSVDDGGSSLTVDGSVTSVGAAADGAAVSGNPVLVAGQDGTNAQSLKTDANGELQIDVLSIAAGDNNIGNVDLASAIPAGTNNIGDVDIASIAAGDNNIGNVDVATVPADPFGANADAAATAGSTGSIQAKLRLVTSQLDAVKTAVETLDNVVSGAEAQVDVVGALPAGTNNIGDVDVLTVPADPFGANADAAATAGSTGSVQAKLRLMTSQLDAVKTAVETLDNTVSGSELQVDVVAALPAGTNAIGKLAANSGVDIGDVDVTSIAAGTNTIGAVNVKPTTAGGLTIFRSIDLDETEEEVKATAGQVFGWYIYNDGAAEVYVKLYNATAANVTVGTTTPVMTIPIPATSVANVEFTNGIAFGTAITAAATTGVADNDTAAPAANQVVCNLLYA